MDELLRQLGELVLGSVPTMLIFLVLVGAYIALVYRPLRRTLAERRARTEGAVQQAHAMIAAADAKAQEYEARLRAARLEIFARREKQVQEWNAARDAAIASAREDAHRKVVAARAALAAQAEAARASLESSIDQLSTAILGVILPAGTGQERAR
jgi:F-type H+-transporting ATPase subunit b